jgi:hypothetical protein
LLKGPIFYTKEEESATSENEFKIGSLMFMNAFLFILVVLKCFVNKVNMHISNSLSQLANLKNYFSKVSSALWKQVTSAKPKNEFEIAKSEFKLIIFTLVNLLQPS